MSIPEFAFVQMATELPFAQLVQLGCALTASYRISPESGSLEEHKPVTTLGRLRAYMQLLASSDPYARGLARAREALAYVCEGAESPMEIALYLLLALPREHGGRGIKGLEMNFEVRLDADDAGILDRPDRRFVRIDIGIPALKRGIEYKGKHHDDTVRADRERENLLSALGYITLQVVYENLAKEDYLERLVNQAERLFCEDRREPTEAERAIRRRLLMLLLGPNKLVL